MTLLQEPRSPHDDKRQKCSMAAIAKAAERKSKAAYKEAARAAAKEAVKAAAKAASLGGGRDRCTLSPMGSRCARRSNKEIRRQLQASALSNMQQSLVAADAMRGAATSNGGTTSEFGGRNSSLHKHLSPQPRRRLRSPQLGVTRSRSDGVSGPGRLLPIDASSHQLPIPLPFGGDTSPPSPTDSVSRKHPTGTGRERHNSKAAARKEEDGETRPAARTGSRGNRTRSISPHRVRTRNSSKPSGSKHLRHGRSGETRGKSMDLPTTAEERRHQDSSQHQHPTSTTTTERDTTTTATSNNRGASTEPSSRVDDGRPRRSSAPATTLTRRSRKLQRSLSESSSLFKNHLSSSKARAPRSSTPPPRLHHRRSASKSPSRRPTTDSKQPTTTTTTGSKPSMLSSTTTQETGRNRARKLQLKGLRKSTSFNGNNNSTIRTVSNATMSGNLATNYESIKRDTTTTGSSRAPSKMPSLDSAISPQSLSSSSSSSLTVRSSPRSILRKSASDDFELIHSPVISNSVSSRVANAVSSRVANGASATIGLLFNLARLRVDFDKPDLETSSNKNNNNNNNNNDNNGFAQRQSLHSSSLGSTSVEATKAAATTTYLTYSMWDRNAETRKKGSNYKQSSSDHYPTDHVSSSKASPPSGRDSRKVRTVSTTDNETLTTSSSTKEPSKKVHFTSVGIRLYERSVGDNPAVNAGVPICLGWRYMPEEEVNIDRFEAYVRRSGKRTRKDFFLTPQQRLYILADDWGYSMQSIVNAEDDAAEIRSQRQASVAGLGPGCGPIFSHGTNSNNNNTNNPRAIMPLPQTPMLTVSQPTLRPFKFDRKGKKSRNTMKGKLHHGDLSSSNQSKDRWSTFPAESVIA